ncbi:hypothetical protein [Cryptosporangium sp. NPDC048952]|uniref:hypothetical protein n=1 Tax=Cryptosporangium sp. NPDC048952 TaxID=3363961 RepID=UPI00371414A9
MDLSLAILFGLAALYAGTVMFLALIGQHGPQRAAASGAGTTAGVAACLVVMVLLAQVTVIATVAAVAVFSGAVAFLALLRDVGRLRAIVAGSGAAALISVSFMFVSYLAVLAFLGAAGVYVLLRLWVRTRPALLVMGGTLSGLLAASGLVFALALSTM